MPNPLDGRDDPLGPFGCNGPHDLFPVVRDVGMRSELREDALRKPRDPHPELRRQVAIARLPFAEFDGSAGSEVQSIEIHRADTLPPTVVGARPDLCCRGCQDSRPCVDRRLIPRVGLSLEQALVEQQQRVRCSRSRLSSQA